MRISWNKKNKMGNCNISHTKKEKTTITKILSKIKTKIIIINYIIKL